MMLLAETPFLRARIGKLCTAITEYLEAKDQFTAAAGNPKCTNECFTVPRDKMFAALQKLRDLTKP